MSNINAATIISVILSAASAIFIFLAERKIDKKAKKADERDENNQRFFLILLKMSNATIALAESTAKAVQRIPDAHCNGDMHAALKYAQKMKHETKDFIIEKGVERINE